MTSVLFSKKDYNWERTKEIKSWTDFREEQFLYNFDRFGLKNQPIDILEVGSFEGASACWFIENAHPDSQLHLIDQYFNDTFYHNIDIAASVHNRYPILHEGLSEDILPTLKNRSFDLIYIDAGHTYDCVSLDLEFASYLLRPGGYLVLDDYDEVWPGVVMAADEFMREREDEYEIADKKGYTLWLQLL